VSENPANAEEGAEETVVARSEVEVGHHAKALSFWVIRLAKVGLEHGKVVERGLACLKGPTDFWMKGKREKIKIQGQWLVSHKRYKVTLQDNCNVAL
jgi:hypothetical protein